MSVRDFINKLMAAKYVKKKQIIDAAASSCVDLDLIDLSSIEEGKAVEVCLSLMRRLNGERDARIKILSQPIHSAKRAASIHTWCNAELNILKSRKTWHSQLLLLELELFWFENAIDIFELMEQLRVRRKPSNDIIRYLLAVSMHPVPPQMREHLQEYVSMRYKHNQLFYQLHSLIYEFDSVIERIRLLGGRVTSERLAELGVYSERLDLLAVADEKRWWSKESFIKTIQVRLHEHYL